MECVETGLEVGLGGDELGEDGVKERKEGCVGGEGGKEVGNVCRHVGWLRREGCELMRENVKIVYAEARYGGRS